MERRNLLIRATQGLGGLFALVLGIPALAYLTDARNRKNGESDFKTVGRLSDLEIGKPTLAAIQDIRRDAWTIHPHDVLGRVWLIRTGPKELDVFTATCPHLGCSVNFEPGSRIFICPCHNGTFEINGNRKENTVAANPAPRGMDRLQWRPSSTDPDLIQVKFENFIQGQDTSIPKA